LWLLLALPATGVTLGLAQGHLQKLQWLLRALQDTEGQPLDGNRPEKLYFSIRSTLIHRVEIQKKVLFKLLVYFFIFERIKNCIFTKMIRRWKNISMSNSVCFEGIFRLKNVA